MRAQPAREGSSNPVARWPQPFPKDLPASLEPVALRLERAALPELDAWEARSRAEGRADTVAPLITHARAWTLNRTPIRFNALWRGKQGGRLYPYLLPGYSGGLLASRRHHDAAPVRLLLAALAKPVRAHLRTADGLELRAFDIRNAHGALAAAWSGDRNQAEWARGDMHARMGRALVDGPLSGVALPAGMTARDLGKLLNNPMVFGQTSEGYRRSLAGWGLEIPLELAARIYRRWWASFPAFRAGRDRIYGAVEESRLEGRGFELMTPRGWRSRWSFGEVRGFVKGGRRKPLGSVQRSIFSAIFRGLEGDLIRSVCHQLDRWRVRVALPVYDELLIVDDGRGAELNGIMDAVLAAACDDCGFPPGLIRWKAKC